MRENGGGAEENVKFVVPRSVVEGRNGVLGALTRDIVYVSTARNLLESKKVVLSECPKQLEFPY